MNETLYTIELHKHRFSAWAAGRASSVNGCRFRVEKGKDILERAGLDKLIANPSKLPSPNDIDRCHAEWRSDIIAIASKEHQIQFTHGVAAKLINVYFKAAFICGGHHDHERVWALHPPIDSLLLDELYTHDFGGHQQTWREARKIRWSKLDSLQYEKIIKTIRDSMPDAPLWEIEKFWCGYQ